MSDALDLAAHLRYYEELGVDGLSRDSAWRARHGDGVRPADPAPAPVATADTSRAGPSPAKAAEAAVSASSSLVDHAGRLRLIREDIGECTRCKLHTGRTNVVFGVGDPEARLMFVGEGPGADEDEQGEPFVGRAGQLLTQIIKAMGFAREDVYITNVVK